MMDWWLWQSELEIDAYGAKHWYFNKRLHRTDGPAIIYPDGARCWFINGNIYTFEEWFKRLTPELQYNYFWNLDE
jgi:hypothetical protein